MKILCRKITWWWDYHLFSAQSRNLANGKLITPVSLITALTFSNLRQRIAQFNGGFLSHRTMNFYTTHVWCVYLEENQEISPQKSMSHHMRILKRCTRRVEHQWHVWPRKCQIRLGGLLLLFLYTKAHTWIK